MYFALPYVVCRCLGVKEEDSLNKSVVSSETETYGLLYMTLSRLKLTCIILGCVRYVPDNMPLNMHLQYDLITHSHDQQVCKAVNPAIRSLSAMQVIPQLPRGIDQNPSF